MLVELVPLAFSLAVGWLRGGSLKNLVALDLRIPWVALVALLLQAMIINVTGSRSALFAPLYIGSFVLLGIFFAKNTRVPFFWIMALGVLLNFLVIAANGGYMLADQRAFAHSGTAGAGEHVEGHTIPADEGTRLNVLGDVIPVQLEKVGVRMFISVGDIVLAIGTFLFVQAAMIVSRRKPASQSSIGSG